MRKVSEKSSIVLLRMLCMILLFQFCFSITCIQNELEALLQFKRSFDDPYYRLASWKGTECCSWDGVGCNQITQHVTMIDLRSDINQVDFYSLPLSANSIDSSLLELKYLNYLDLSGNHFNYTQIPSFLGSMEELTYLNLSFALFSGKLPPHLGNLTKLAVLDLSFNWPETNDDIEWISHLSSLQFLSLTGIDFSKTSNLIQVLTSFPWLVSLRLNYCNLQNIPFSLVSSNYSSFLSRVQLLDLSYNQLSGSIPKAFQNMTSLKFLYLSRNKFTGIEGGLSSFIRNNCGLKVINLSMNKDFGGDVFDSSYENEFVGCSHGHDLQVLQLSDTSMKTKIPIDWLGKFKNLKLVDLSYSKIHGSIPAALGNLSSIEYLDLSNNALTGEIPTSMGRLLNLKVLDISSNSLKGVLTEAHFVNLSKLHTLYLSYNELISLDMKPNWIPPFQLKKLDIGSCIGSYGSEFPQWLQTQKALDELWLSNTSLSVSCLPTWFTPQNLTTLDLSHNQIVGPIFNSIADQMPRLTHLFLNDNFLNDSLPLVLCKLKSLFTLDLSNNRLSGTVHGCLFTLNLTLLDLSSNYFSGTFPDSHANPSLLYELFLRNNNFEGSMPIVLKNAKSLKILDMEGNKFSGNILTWVGDNLQSLQVLRLRSNLFNGTIPSSLCNLPNLQILDLAHNQLDGSIPSNLNNFDVMITGKGIQEFIRFCWRRLCLNTEKNVVQFIKSNHFNYSTTQLRLMVNIDLSNNSLVGFIPKEITMLKRLIGLNLSYNNLIGTIPMEIGELESLESLDLSFNKLSGRIPQSLSKLNSLGALELSHNNFSGNIPREGHLSTFNEASSFDENLHLCGNPLPIKCVNENPYELPSKNIDDNLDQDQEDKWEKWLLYITIILGYIVGFWVVVGSLILKTGWRHAYFKFVDEGYYKVHATIWRS
ncbi:receptor-like protein EIX2 [Cucumis melo]|nr:receptor-like protein EIX2 [Cucumis melo]